jgi:trimeric autotransporter adhesin
MKYTIKQTLTILCLLIATGMHAQTIERKVINSMGGSLTPGGGPQLTHNLGETFSTTLVAGGYSLTQGFLQYSIVAVPPINGTLTVCVGATTALTDSMSGGTWSSGNTSVATVGSTGVVTGVAAGTSTISYVVSGSSATAVVTVNPLPAAGVISIASGGLSIGQSFGGGKVAYILQAGDPGYDATMQKGLIAATSDQSTGIQWGCAGVASGATASVIGSGAANTTLIATICGAGTAGYLCDNLTLNGYSDWYLPSYNELNKLYANRGAIGGFSTALYWSSTELTGLNSWYQDFSTGGFGFNPGKTYPRNVRAVRSFTGGSSSICVGGTMTLSPSVSGGSWNTSSAAIATVSSSGVVTAVSGGTATISYSVTNSCGTTSATMVITVDPSAGTITGSSAVCAGSTITLSNTTSGGSWSSSNASVATIGSTGVVTGISGGIVTISYTVTNSCGTAAATKVVTVNTIAGGIPTSGLVAWYPFNGNSNDESGNGNNGTNYGAALSIDRFGNANSAYSFNGTSSYIACPSLSALDGSSAITISAWTKIVGYNSNIYCSLGCAQSIVQRGSDYHDIGAFQLYYVQDSTNAVYYGRTKGISTLSDLVICSCSLPIPQIIWHHIVYTSNGYVQSIYIDGALSNQSTYSVYTPVGAYSANVFLGKNDVSGYNYFLNGNLDDVGFWNRALSSSEITQLYNAGNIAGTITGASTVCTGSTITLTDSTTGGSWSSSNTSVATVGSTGIVTGAAAGTTTISYTVTNACGSGVATKVITVTATPTVGTIPVYAGTMSVGQTYQGGKVAYILQPGDPGYVAGRKKGIIAAPSDQSSGIKWGIYGTYAGVTATALGTGAANTTAVIAVHGTGTATHMCDTLTLGSYSDWFLPSKDELNKMYLNKAAIGGFAGADYWASSERDAYVAWAQYFVNGDLSMAAGKDQLRRVRAVRYFNVSMAELCIGDTVSLTNTTSGGSWTSSNTAIATVGTSGKVTATGAGTVAISYTISNSCGSATATAILTVNGTPSAGTITGSSAVCAGSMITLSNATSGGSWSSSNTSVATIGSTGVVTGIAAGTATISYTVTNACGSGVATKVITVNPTPSAGTITGASSVCGGSTITLTNATTGGSWSSSNTAIATVGSTGVVSGVSAGTATISYTFTNSCGTATATKIVTVSTAYASNMSLQLDGVDDYGLVTSAFFPNIYQRNFTIEFYLKPDSGQSQYPGVWGKTQYWGEINVELYVPNNVRFFYATYIGGNHYETSPTAPYSANQWDHFAIVGDSASNLLKMFKNGNLVGTSSHSSPDWSVPSNDSRIGAVFQGWVSPHIQYLKGRLDDFRVSSVARYSSSFTPPQNLTTDAQTAVLYNFNSISGGVVSDLSGNNNHLTLFNGANLSSDVPYSGASLPAIAGPSSVYVGATITLADSTAGGSWSSSNISIATVGSTGVVTGVAPGTVTISYTVSNACGSAVATKVVTVNSAISSPITGTLTTCIGATTTLSNTTTGGTWSSSTPAVATIGSASGIVTGVSAGTSTITYTVGGSYVTAVVSVYAMPAGITGGGSACAGATITLACTTTGGSWSSSNTSAATVGSTGIVTGVATGTSVISYTISGACSSTKTITINASPSAIGGTLNGCIAMTNTLTCTPSGGAWSSSTTSVANINSSGQATGYAAGTTTITYALSTGCRSTAVLTINVLPDSVSGTAVVCAGLTTTFTGYPSGGNWASSNTTKATVDASGIVTGVALGTARITYSNAGGCYKTKIVTVNAAPLAITGTAAVCVGNTTTLACPGGGTWSSSTMAVGTVNASGVVRGLSAGTTTITYRLSTGCINTRVVTVNNAPAAITGTANICAGTTTTLSSTPTGGTWSSSGLTVGTVGSTTGVVTGITGGAVTITYTIAGGCRATKAVTVNNNPPSIGGTATLATGGTTTLTNGLTGGTWSSGNTGVATVVSTGLVSGISSGTARISYTSAAGCSATKVVTVSGAIGAITGNTTLCTGTTSSLSCTPTGGAWSSTNTAVATVTSGGLVSGVSAGTATIIYTISGTSVTTVVTVYTMPAAITGSGLACTGATTTLTCTTTGGTWSSSNTATATVGSTGIVTGVAAGTVTISYSMGGSCVSTKAMTVNTTPGAIAGTMSTCVGTSATLSGTPTGGAWSSSTPGVANIDGSGSYAGTSAGTATITYGLGTGCYSTAVVTINAVPAAITGTLSICEGTSTTLSSTTTGGSWSSSNTSVATVGSAGTVNGVAAGNATITYTQGGCNTTVVVTVQPTPSAIAGALAVCEGNTGTLTNASSGGTWLSDNTAVATVGSSSGVVTGIAAGTANVTYTVSTGCTVTAVVTVNGVPGSITGTGTVCTGTTTTLSCTTTGGTWVTTTPSVATVGSATGIVTGVSAGTAVVTYSAGSGCYSTTVVTINATPGTPAGTATVCEGATTTLTSTITGGTWSSSNTSVATVNSTGVVSGVAAGTADIAYTLSTGCQGVRTVTVNAQPAAVTGAGTICTGTTLAVSCATTGGTWSSGAPSVANVGSSTGVVTGVTAGTANISYTVGGCSSSATVTVNLTPATITGTANVCPGTTTTLSTTTTGGSWSSANTATATVGSTGIVTGVAAGTVSISYTLNGCSSSKTVTVNALPGAIGGGPTLCSGITTTLTATPSGGTWSSSTTTVGTVASTTGAFTGITGGTTTVTYKLATGCQTTQVLTINPTPAAISGASTVCMGTTITLTSATTGGSWTSSNTGVATVSSSGVVSSVAMGTATISYTTGSCSVTKLVTVNTIFVSDTTYNMCLGVTKTLVDAVPGGTWASSTPSIASVVSATGVATSFAVGMTTITYSFGAGCSKTTPLYVQNTSATILGSGTLCEGSSSSMSVASAYSGGSWSSSNTGVAVINMSTGVITGVSTGTTVLTYTLIDCYTTRVVTVNPRPATITGTTFACIGATTTLSSATTGGSWTSSVVARATVGSSTGVVTGVAAGTSVISYTLGTGCSRTAVVTVSGSPASITGTTNVCVGNTINLANTSAGGTWSSSNASVASVDASGVVSGVTPGVATISYGFGGTCTATKTITVNPTPGSSSGPDVVCAGLTITLTNSLTGGTWSSSSATTATANSSTGLITGVNAGVVNITYSAPGSCITVKQVTVNAAMPAITGGTSVCVGSTVNLSTTATGGTWSSSVPAKATIDGTTGVVTGVATGSSTITYMVSTGCYKTSAMVVNAAPAAISGASSVVVGSSTTLTCGTTGGAWSSSNTAVGTVTSASGAVTGISTGTMSISYTITTTGCRSIKAMTVNPTPLAKGVGETANGGSIKFAVYPNPTQGTLTVETSVAGTFRMFTIDSKLLGTYHIEAPSSTIQLPSDLASGIYMCQFSREDGTMETVRLIYQQ